MDEMHTFARNDVFPSWFPNSLQKALSVLAHNFQLTKQDATHVQVTAGATVAAAVIGVQGRWRWSEATVTRAHPGGAAGTYDIFAVAADNKIDSTPAAGTDDTNYAFELRILKAGETPTIIKGTLDIFRKVGSCEWNGTEITRVDQTVPGTPTHAHRHATGQPDAIAPADIGAAPEAEAEALRAMTGERVMQAGVVKTTDWSFTSTINAATGALSSAAATGGAAWVSVGGALVRSNTATAVFGPLVPPALPANGKYLSVGVQLKPGIFGGPATVSLVAGVEKATEAEALAAPAAAVAGAVRMRDIIVKNSAGVYSIATERDRRPWATGLDYAQHVESVELNENGTSAVLWKRRFETAAPGVRADLSAHMFLTGSGTYLSGGFYLLVDGELHGTWEYQTPIGSGRAAFELSGPRFIGTAEVRNGSHLWELQAHNFTAGTGTTTRMLFEPDLFLREIPYAQDAQNNGAS